MRDSTHFAFSMTASTFSLADLTLKHSVVFFVLVGT